MTIKKYTRCLILKICVLKKKKIQNKNMQVSLRSNRSAHSYFKAWLSVFFPKRGTAKTRLPSTEKRMRQTMIQRQQRRRENWDQTEWRQKTTGIWWGKPESILWLKKNNIHSLRSISQVFVLISFGSFIDSVIFVFSFYPIDKIPSLHEEVL